MAFLRLFYFSEVKKGAQPAYLLSKLSDCLNLSVEFLIMSFLWSEPRWTLLASSHQSCFTHCPSCCYICNTVENTLVLNSPHFGCKWAVDVAFQLTSFPSMYRMRSVTPNPIGLLPYFLMHEMFYFNQMEGLQALQPDLSPLSSPASRSLTSLTNTHMHM